MQLLPQFTIEQFAQKMIGTEAQRQEAITEATDSLALLLDSNFDVMQSKWQALAAATIAQRKKLGYGATPVLIRRTGSDALRARATKNRDPQVHGLVATGSVHTDDEIAVTLNNGTRDGRIPSRPFYILSGPQKDQAHATNHEIVYRWLTRKTS